MEVIFYFPFYMLCAGALIQSANDRAFVGFKVSGKH